MLVTQAELLPLEQAFKITLVVSFLLPQSIDSFSSVGKLILVVLNKPGCVRGLGYVYTGHSDGRFMSHNYLLRSDVFI